MMKITYSHYTMKIFCALILFININSSTCRQITTSTTNIQNKWPGNTTHRYDKEEKTTTRLLDNVTRYNRKEKWPQSINSMTKLSYPITNVLKCIKACTTCLKDRSYCYLMQQWCYQQRLMFCPIREQQPCFHSSCLKTCDDEYDCEWENSVCNNKICWCKYNYIPNYEKKRCQYISDELSTLATTTTKTHSIRFPTIKSNSFRFPTEMIKPTNNFDQFYGYNIDCFVRADCPWRTTVCRSGRCTCPENYLPNYASRECYRNYSYDKFKNNNNYIIGIGATAIIILLFVSFCICASRKNSSNLSRNSRPIGVEGTSSTLELLGELNDLPPDYSDVYMIGPQDRTDQGHFKLPSYEEAVRQSEYDSQPLHAVIGNYLEEPVNTREETNPRSPRATTSQLEPSAQILATTGEQSSDNDDDCGTNCQFIVYTI